MPLQATEFSVSVRPNKYAEQLTARLRGHLGTLESDDQAWWSASIDAFEIRGMPADGENFTDVFPNRDAARAALRDALLALADELAKPLSEVYVASGK